MMRRGEEKRRGEKKREEREMKGRTEDYSEDN